MKIIALILLLTFSSTAFGAPQKGKSQDQKIQSESAPITQLTPDAYGPLRSLAYDIDDAASKILEELLKEKNQAPSLIDAVTSYSSDAHQFRIRVVDYRKKPWNMEPEIIRLQDALKEVRKQIKNPRDHDKKFEVLAGYLGEALNLYAKDPKDYKLPDISNGKK